MSLYYITTFCYDYIVLHSLLDRQELWRRTEEERIASLPDPSIPPGHTLMPKTERLNTLELLETSKYL